MAMLLKADGVSVFAFRSKTGLPQALIEAARVLSADPEKFDELGVKLSTDAESGFEIFLPYKKEQ